MSSAEVSDAIRQFLMEHIHTYEELEVVVLLQKRPQETWTAEALSQALAIPVELASDASSILQARGIVDSVELPAGAKAFRGPSEAFRHRVEELALLYEQHKIEIVMLMSANSIERMRTGAMRAFADAFFIGRKK